MSKDTVTSSGKRTKPVKSRDVASWARFAANREGSVRGMAVAQRLVLWGGGVAGAYAVVWCAMWLWAGVTISPLDPIAGSLTAGQGVTARVAAVLTLGAVVSCVAVAAWLRSVYRSKHYRDAAGLRLDEAMGLRGAFSAGLAFSSREQQGSIATLALRDAERLCHEPEFHSRVFKALPKHRWQSWTVPLVVLIGSLALLAMIPSRQRVDTEDPSHRVAMVQQIDTLRKDVAAESKRETEAENASRDASGANSARVSADRLMSALDGIKDQLASKNKTPEEARAQAASVIQRHAEALQLDADQRVDALDRVRLDTAAHAKDLRDRLSGQPTDTDSGRPLDRAELSDEVLRLADSLSRGDLSESHREMQSMDTSKLSPIDEAALESLATSIQEALDDSQKRIEEQPRFTDPAMHTQPPDKGETGESERNSPDSNVLPHDTQTKTNTSQTDSHSFAEKTQTTSTPFSGSSDTPKRDFQLSGAPPDTSPSNKPQSVSEQSAEHNRGDSTRSEQNDKQSPQPSTSSQESAKPRDPTKQHGQPAGQPGEQTNEITRSSSTPKSESPSSKSKDDTGATKPSTQSGGKPDSVSSANSSEKQAKDVPAERPDVTKNQPGHTGDPKTQPDQVPTQTTPNNANSENSGQAPAEKQSGANRTSGSEQNTQPAPSLRENVRTPSSENNAQLSPEKQALPSADAKEDGHADSQPAQNDHGLKDRPLQSDGEPGNAPDERESIDRARIEQRRNEDTQHDQRGPAAAQRLRESLKRWQNQQQQVEDQMRQAQKYAQRARDMLDTTSIDDRNEGKSLPPGYVLGDESDPELRGDGGRFPSDGSRHSNQTDGQNEPWDFETQSVEGTTSDSPRHTSGSSQEFRLPAEWKDFQPLQPTRRAGSTEWRAASSAADRAIESGRVPIRHRDLVQRVFGRFTQRSNDATQPANPQLAPDVDALKNRE